MTKTDKRKTIEPETNRKTAQPQAGPAPLPSEGGTPNAPAVAPEPAAALSPEQIEELKAQAAKADEHWDRVLRTAAELDNFRKRAARDKQEAIRLANEALLKTLIPVLDNFESALAAANHSQSEHAQSLQTGVAMIYQQFKSALAEAGLEEIDATNKPFDPNWHEAISQQETADAPEGQVVQQLRKGYKLRERLLRPAGVIVSRKPEPNAKSSTSARPQA